MNTTRIVFVGGFLGAGKTTLLQNITQRLLQAGHQVGIVTNDQAPGLVDTLLLAQDNRNIKEVSGSCFCCNYNGLLEALQQMRQEQRATIILAEPVGSCTDLSATILQPLKEHLRTVFSLSPLSVVVDAVKLKAMMQGLPVGLHPSAEYILRKQLEEADIVVINKIDLLAGDDITRLNKYMEFTYPESSRFFLSAQTGEGVQEWLDVTIQRNDAGNRIIEVDYDQYAEGEAVLGWLNGTLTCEGETTEWNDFIYKLLSDIGQQLEKTGASVGHIKIIAVSEDGNQTISNLTGSMETLEVRGDSLSSRSAQLTINARAEIAPDQLERVVRNALDKACDNSLTRTTIAWRTLVPGRPTPTHRYKKKFQINRQDRSQAK